MITFELYHPNPVAMSRNIAKQRKYGTCFFEHYAQITLASILGSEFDCLVNRDRPDLQSEGDHHLGIEVTRAMEESKKAGLEMLKDVAGITEALPEAIDVEQILETGYSYGLRGGRWTGAKELDYWEMAYPLRRILQSKVSKVGNGFYGHYDKMGLFVFCKDQISEVDAQGAMVYVIGLQKFQDIRFNRLYLADIDDLFVCNLDDGLQASSRLLRYPITQDQRRAFYLEAIRRQI